MYEYNVEIAEVDYNFLNDLVERALWQGIEFEEVAENFEDEAREIIELGVLEYVEEGTDKNEIAELIGEAIDSDLNDVISELAQDFLSELKMELENKVDYLNDSIASLENY